MFKAPVFICVLSAVIGMASLCRAAGYGFDTITPPAVYAGQLAEAGLTGSQGAWMRVRGLVDPVLAKAGDARTVESDREGLRGLRARGIKTAVFLRWERSSWANGVRGGGGHRVPLDLREAFERGRRLGETYGDLVDVWEIENEPDIDFMAENPETFTAFQKALYLGLKSGASASAVSLSHKVKLKALPAESTWLAQKRGGSELNLQLSSSTCGAITTPRVVMAPLALPPGPYLERLWANGIASYTDGFNFHYYGYAEDFSGVYEQFRDAVAKLGADAPSLVEVEGGRLRGRVDSKLNLKLKTSSDGQRKALPVFITEYGFGLLDAEARDTVAGRVRQWRWFASVIAQVRALRPEGPMAFLVDPYYEADLNEFGLTMTAQPELLRSSLSHKIKFKKDTRKKTAPHAVFSEGTADTAVATQGGVVKGTGVRSTSSRASGLLQFEAADFGMKRMQPWMERIGDGVGGNHASPALAYLWDYAERHPYRPRDWSVVASPASPVVIDMVAGRGMAQMKSSGGYELSGHVEVANYVLSGRAKWVLYNFSPDAITGRLEIAGEGVASRLVARTVTLAAGERREIIDDLGVQAEVFAGRVLRASFTPEDGRVARSVWATRLFPTSEWMVSKREAGFDFPMKSVIQRRADLEARRLAEGEAQLLAQGRWLATDGVRVEERDGVWRFHIDHLPAEPLRPAAVELPLPEWFVFKPGTALTLERRKVEAGVAERLGDRRPDGGQRPEAGMPNSRTLRSNVPGQPEAARMKSRAGRAGDVMDVYFRTENGNLYQTWPRLRVTEDWTGYSEQAENFTMGFFGRAALPWRFADNRPAALVFFLRPSELPAVFEVRDARIERVARSSD